MWLLSRIEKGVNFWCNHWISRGGRLVLIKSILEDILVYWHLLDHIPNGILDRIRKVYFNYLWKGSCDYKGSHLKNWKVISLPKDQGGCGIKKNFLFGKSIETKSLWNFLTRDNLWRRIII